MRPMGTLAAPMKEVVSRTKARMGWPSGAFGIEVPEVGVKRALRGVMRAMGKAVKMAMAWGVRKERRNVFSFGMMLRRSL